MNRSAPEHEPLLAWPDWRILGTALAFGTAQTLWWILVYVGADWLTSLRTTRVRLHFDAELDIPFCPAWILVYRSIDVMFLLGPFILRSRAEIIGLTSTLAVVTGVAGVGFLLLPAELAYPPQPFGAWESLFDWNRAIVRTYNLAPSLHVALSTVTLAAYGQRAEVLGKTAFAAWGSAIALSTLLIHQHHVVDVVTGLLLGWMGHVWVYRRFLDAARVAQSVGASPSSDPAPLA